MRLEKMAIESQSLKTSDVHEQPHSPRDNDSLNDQQDIINKAKVETVVSQLNGFIEPLRTNVQFKLHEELDEYYVTVVNSLNNEVIKEIPPKKMLDMYAAMTEYMGLLVDEKI